MRTAQRNRQIVLQRPTPSPSQAEVAAAVKVVATVDGAVARLIAVSDADGAGSRAAVDELRTALVEQMRQFDPSRPLASQLRSMTGACDVFLGKQPARDGGPRRGRRPPLQTLGAGRTQELSDHLLRCIDEVTGVHGIEPPGSIRGETATAGPAVPVVPSPSTAIAPAPAAPRREVAADDVAPADAAPDGAIDVVSWAIDLRELRGERQEETASRPDLPNAPASARRAPRRRVQDETAPQSDARSAPVRERRPPRPRRPVQKGAGAGVKLEPITGVTHELIAALPVAGPAAPAPSVTPAPSMTPAPSRLEVPAAAATPAAWERGIPAAALAAACFLVTVVAALSTFLLLRQ